MGVDFIRKTAKSFHKGLDQSRIDLGTPDLFTLEPSTQPRAYSANIRANTKLAHGEVLSVRSEDGNVVAQRGMDIVAKFEKPPAALLKAIESSHGEAYGTVLTVHEYADVAEITVC